MCNQADRDTIELIVEGFMLSNAKFTAYDVTKEARLRGITERHGVIKRIVHSIMEDANIKYDPNDGTPIYARTLVETPTGNAFLYHPDVEAAPARWGFPDDVTDPDDDDDDATVAPLAKSATTLLNALVAGTNLIHKQKMDAEGRLPIYGNVLRTIGANPGDVVYVSTMGLLSKKASNDAVAYTVNADGRIRISKSVLQDIFGRISDNWRPFEFHAVADTVRIYVV